MTNLRQAIAPAYLFLCIVMGGSAQGIFSNLALQLAGVAILAWAFLTRVPLTSSRPARQLAWLAAAAIGLVVLQLIALPPALWGNLPGRIFVIDGFQLLGQLKPPFFQQAYFYIDCFKPLANLCQFCGRFGCGQLGLQRVFFKT